MAFCNKCGKEIADGYKVCAECANQSESNGENSFVDKVIELNNTEDTTFEYDQNDVQQNKILAALAYLGILVLIPIFAVQNSRFCRFHANQGLVLLIFSAAYGIIAAIIKAIVVAAFAISLLLTGVSIVVTIVNIILWLGGLVFAALMVLGIVNAATGKAKKLPVIGKITILKY